MKIQLLALIIGMAYFTSSCDKNKESHDHEGHKSHHKEHGDGKHHFGRHDGFHSMNPDSMAKFRTEKMKEQLDLTEEQLPKVEQVNLKYANKAKELREQMKQLEEERRKELSTILTQEQLEKLKTKREHHKKEQEDDADEDH